MDFPLDVNGFAYTASYPDSTVRGVLLPLLRELSDRQRRAQRRLIVLLGAPPGTGKSTFAAVLEQLAAQEPGLVPVQALGMDGFHLHQDYLLSHRILHNGAELPMTAVKGMPETFDAPKLRRALEASLEGDPLWPAYDRRIHDVVENAVQVRAPILIVEGNWLLLDRPEWRALPRDLSLFIGAEEKQLRGRLIARKMRGGLSRQEAEAFYERTDGPNIRLCMAHSCAADYRYTLADDGGLTLSNSRKER